MADRTSASVFGKIFTLLAKNPTEEHKQIALELWPEIGEFDFSPYQMYCDHELVLLDLAQDDIDEDGDIIIKYGPINH